MGRIVKNMTKSKYHIEIRDTDGEYKGAREEVVFDSREDFLKYCVEHKECGYSADIIEVNEIIPLTSFLNSDSTKKAITCLYSALGSKPLTWDDLVSFLT